MIAASIYGNTATYGNFPYIATASFYVGTTGQVAVVAVLPWLGQSRRPTGPYTPSGWRTPPLATSAQHPPRQPQTLPGTRGNTMDGHRQARCG